MQKFLEKIVQLLTNSLSKPCTTFRIYWEIFTFLRFPVEKVVQLLILKMTLMMKMTLIGNRKGRLFKALF